MPEIQVNRDMIIHGAATRLELDDVDLGPTLGPVIVRREVELIDITTDLGTVVDKFATRNQMFIEMELASSSIDNLLIAWGGTKQQVTDELTNEITSITLELDPKDASEETKKMVIEAPGTENFFRRYWFPNVVSLVQTQRSIQKGGIISVPVEFEVIKDPSLGLQQFGRIQEIINAAGINIWDGNDQSKAGATELAPFIVEVRDQDGSPLSGVTVNWLVTAGGGSLSDASVDTGANGRAQTTLTLGSTQGTNTVTATVMVDNVASISNIPASPTVGDIIHFTTTITAGIPSTIKDKDGTTTVALIGIGDEHRWDGTNWLRFEKYIATFNAISSGI